MMRSPAHERAIRRAWLLRRERRVFRDAAEQLTDQRTMLQGNLREADEAKAKAIRGRRRALLLARDFQQRLYAEYRLVDRINERNRQRRRAA